MKLLERVFGQVCLLESQCFKDDRGYFFESFNKAQFNEVVGQEVNFVQDNSSLSQNHVIRGLHYQVVKPQGKLVRVLSGSVKDVVVDIRESSETFGKYRTFDLTEDNCRAIWIPPGFAHGFLSLSDNTIFTYKVTEYWFKEHDRAIIWNDNDLAIDWGRGDFIVSQKDMTGKIFKEAEYFK